jgi:phenylalanine-4-hydroxylase
LLSIAAPPVLAGEAGWLEPSLRWLGRAGKAAWELNPSGRQGLCWIMAVSDRLRPDAVADDWTIPQNWAGYTAADHAIWDRLFARQVQLLRTRAAPEFLAGIEALELDRPGIPDFERLSERLMKTTGWQVVAVPGLIPAEAFFDHLAHRRFVAGNFIRSAEQIDYLEEPDVFHDVFGHVPLLALPEFADYMQAYGRGGLRAARLGAIERLSRLYWYTVEFGLVRSRDGLRIYGSGIASSRGETIYALDDPSPRRIRFDLERVMRTRYRIDDFQQCYFVIDSFEDLRRRTEEPDFAPIYDRLSTMPDIEPGAVLPADELL